MQTVSSNSAHSGTAGAQVGIRTSTTVSFKVDSQTTTLGFRSHIVTTPERNFAYALYEQALEIDSEPTLAIFRGVWIIGFICNDSERDNALSLAVGVTA